MASRRSRTRRILPPIVLAVALAAEITGIALARSLAPATVVPVAAPAQAAAAAVPATAAVDGAGRTLLRPDPASDAAPASMPVATSSGTVAAHGFRPAPAARPAHKAAPAAPSRPKTPTVHVAKPAPAPSHKTAPSYHGVNHVWIPSLGINKAIQWFPCSRNRPPDAGVYQWGCSGHNNVYLLSHAWSTFKPLHDAYVGGRLRKGMKVIYADGGGHVHTYSVIWWKVTAPTTAASWAWAPLSSPGMTLQTCVGANSAYRLMVRLTRIA